MSPTERRRASAVYGPNVREWGNLCDGRRTIALASAYVSASALDLRARDQDHAADDLRVAANEHPLRLRLPLECSARFHASTTNRAQSYRIAIDSARSPVLAGSISGERIALSASHASGQRFHTR
jgi:hypothetical protein